MKERIKQWTQRYPVLEKYLRVLSKGGKILATRPKKNIKGTNNVIAVAPSTTLYHCAFELAGNNNRIEIAESCIMNHVTFYIRGNNNHIKIGRHVKFFRGGSVWIEDDHGEAIVGDETTFEDVHIAVTEPHSKITIGENCMFANDIDIRTGDSHSILDATTQKRINYAQNIQIGNHVWVASHVSILKGVHLPDNSVVSTRAVVTKPFSESNILIGGIPAKKIKENIDWDRRRV